MAYLHDTPFKNDGTFLMDERYSDGQYAHTNEDWHDGDAPWKAGQIADFLRAQGLTPDSICDVGCGAGGVLAALRAFLPHSRLVGYEPSPQAVELARSLHPEIDVRQGSLEAITETFDVTMLVDVFEHVPDYLGFLRTCSGVGRSVVFHIPLDMTALMVARERPIMNARQTVGHLHYFSKATALATLHTSGFNVVACRYTAGALELPNRTFRMRFASLPRRVAFRMNQDLAVRLVGGYSLLVLAIPTSEPAPLTAEVDP